MFWHPGLVTLLVFISLFVFFLFLYFTSKQQAQIILVKHTAQKGLVNSYANLYQYPTCLEKDIVYNHHSYYVWLYGTDIPATSLAKIIPLLQHADTFTVLDNNTILLHAQRYPTNYQLANYLTKNEVTIPLQNGYIYHNYDPHFVLIPVSCLYAKYQTLSYPLNCNNITAIKEYYPCTYSTIWGKNIIPKKIHQSFETLLIPRIIKNATTSWRQIYKSYQYYYHTSYTCEKFLQQHYSTNVLQAWRSLNANAFRADLWRIAYLYQNGGVYADVKMLAIRSLDAILANHDLVLVLDIGQNMIYNAFMACHAKHPFIKSLLSYTIKHINSKYYGRNKDDVLAITGPSMIYACFKEYIQQDISLGSHIAPDNSTYYILKHDFVNNDRTYGRIHNNGITYVYTRIPYAIPSKQLCTEVTGKLHYSNLYYNTNIYKK